MTTLPESFPRSALLAPPGQVCARSPLVNPAEPPQIQLRGARLHAITERDCARAVGQSLRSGVGGWIITMNLDHLRRFGRDEKYAQYQSHASIVVADGMPLVWASWLQGTRLPERVTGSNLIWSLSGMAATEGRSVFLLGGNPGTAARAAAALVDRFPNLIIAGVYCPPLDFEHDKAETARLAKAVVDSQPDIVYVALGSPKQERIIDGLRHRLASTWWMGVGIAFSFVAGDVPRAPVWMQRCGLEWLHRLTHDPRRLAGRYVLRGIPFALVLLGSSSVRWFQNTAH